MTEEQQPQSTESQKRSSSNDVLLEVLCILANEFELGVGVTLSVKGMLVVGNVVSEARYSAGIAKRFEQSAIEPGYKKIFLTLSRDLEKWIVKLRNLKNLMSSSILRMQGLLLEAEK